MSRPGARVAVAIASLAAVVWLVVALVVITDRGDGGTGSIGTGDTLPEISSVSFATTTTSSPVTTVGSTSAVPTSAATTTTSTVPPPLVIDLAAPAPPMTPQVFATFPIVDPTDPHHGYAVTTDHHNRVVVMDLVSADVSFADLKTGVWTTYPSDVPAASLAGYFVIGPDDVIYAQIVEGQANPTGVAYALRDGRYVEAARYGSGVGDSVVVSGRTGPGVIGVPPLTPYLGTDGSPSGKVLGLNDFVMTNSPSTHLVMSRGTRAWDVEVVHSTCDSMCNTLDFGPRDDALVFSQLGNNRPTYRISWLSDTVRSWNTDWWFAGSVDSGLVFSHVNGDQLEIGLAK